MHMHSSASEKNGSPQSRIESLYLFDFFINPAFKVSNFKLVDLRDVVPNVCRDRL
jgi:hypothetical protein